MDICNYDKNIAMLKTVNETLVKTIDEAKRPDEIIYSSTDEVNDEDFTNLLLNKQNQLLAIYNKKDNIKKINSDIDKGMLHLKNYFVTIIIGMGTGYLVREILKRKEKKHIIIVVETVPFFLKTSLELHDFEESIKNGELLFACPGEVQVHGLIALVDSKYMINGWNVIVDSVAAKWSDKYHNIISYTCDIINQLSCSVGTVVSAGKLFAQNDINTFAYIIRHRGIKELRDIYKDKPAILVNTGPSLQKNIHLLMDKKVRDNVIIVAIAQSLRILLAYDIIPDFITTVDYCETNEEHFKNLWNCDVPLIALNKTYEKILQQYRGPKFIVGSNLPGSFPNTISNMIADKGVVEQGGSVAHMNFGVASLLGCDPVIMLGQDLGFEDNLSHNPNADASGTVELSGDEMLWKVDSPDSHLHDKTYSLGNTFTVEGYYGDACRTSTGLMSFLTAFEKIFENYKGIKTIINSTEGGVNIKNTKRMQLKDVLKKYCTKKIKKKEIKKYLSFADNYEELVDEAINVLNKEIFVFKDIISNCDEGLVWNKKMLHHFNNSKKKLKRDIDMNQQFSSNAENLAKKNPTLSIAIHYAQRKIFSEDMYTVWDEETVRNKKEFKIRVDRNKYILIEAKKACKELLPMYEKSKKLLLKYREYGDESILTKKYCDKFDLNKSHEWFDKGNFAYPYIEAKKMIEKTYKEVENGKVLNDKELIEWELVKFVYDKSLFMRNEIIEESNKRPDRKNDLEYIELIQEAKKIGTKKDFKEAFKLLFKVSELKTTHDNVEAIRGMATSLFMMKKEKRSLIYFKKVCELCPDNLKYKFEYACILLNSDSDLSLKLLREVLKATEKTKEFDFFYKTIGDVLYDSKEYKGAIQAYTAYSKTFPDDISIDQKLKSCFESMKGK